MVRLEPKDLRTEALDLFQGDFLEGYSLSVTREVLPGPHTLQRLSIEGDLHYLIAERDQRC